MVILIAVVLVVVRSIIPSLLSMAIMMYAASHNQEYHGEGEHKDPYCVRCGKTFRGE